MTTAGHSRVQLLVERAVTLQHELAQLAALTEDRRLCMALQALTLALALLREVSSGHGD